MRIDLLVDGEKISEWVVLLPENDPNLSWQGNVRAREEAVKVQMLDIRRRNDKLFQTHGDRISFTIVANTRSHSKSLIHEHFLNQ